MNKLKTPEELAKEVIQAPPYEPIPYGLDEIFAPDGRHTRQFGFAEGVSYTREHEVAPLVEALKCVHSIWNENGVDENGWTEDASGVANELYKEGVIAKIDALLSLYTNNEGK